MPAHTHAGAYVLVALGQGQLAGGCIQPSPLSITQAGFVCVDGEAQHNVSNVGTKSISVLEWEIGQ